MKISRIFYNNFHKKSEVQGGVINKNNFTYIHALKVITNYIKKEKINILDYGCGVGTLDFLLAKEGHNVVGVDISEEAIKLAKQSSKLIGTEKNTDFYTLEKLKSNLNNKKFELILCLETIEHVIDDRKLINYLSKRLLENGILVVSTPSINAPLYRLGLVRAFDKKVGHLRRYSKSSLVKMLENESVNVISLEEREGIIRNSLFVFNFGNLIVRFANKLKTVSLLITAIDNIATIIFGGSNIFIVGKKA